MAQIVRQLQQQALGRLMPPPLVTRNAPYLRARSCEDKRAYATFAAAQRIARRLEVLQLDGTVRPYRCAFCASWHIGHPPAAVLPLSAARLTPVE